MHRYRPLYDSRGSYEPGRTHRGHGLVPEADLAPSAGHATQPAPGARYSPTALPDTYDPRHAVYEDHTSQYRPPQPWHEAVGASTPPLRCPPQEVWEPPSPPDYSDTLMDQWLLDRILSELAWSAPAEPIPFDHDITMRLSAVEDDRGAPAGPIEDPLETQGQNPLGPTGLLEEIVDQEALEGSVRVGHASEPARV